MSWHQRIAAVGMTRSGKSELLRYLFGIARVRRILIDPKREWSIAGVRAVVLRADSDEEALAEIARVDFTAPIVHLCPRWQNRPQLEALYGAIEQVPGDLLVWTDEAYAVSKGGWSPPGLLALQTAGGGRGHGHLIATQRPRNVGRELLTEADHVFIFPPLDDDDLVRVREGVPFLPIEAAREALVTLPPHGYLWADKRARTWRIGDPLPEWMRAQGRPVVRRATPRAA